MLCCILVSLALCFPAWAINETNPTASSEAGMSTDLGTLTVIATKTPKAPLDSPASVSVISEDEISAFNSEHPFKPLFRAEGIYPRQYRGLADYWSRPMIRGNRALVMVDGLNWYDYGHYYHTGAIPMKDIEKNRGGPGSFFRALRHSLPRPVSSTISPRFPMKWRPMPRLPMGKTTPSITVPVLPTAPFATPDDSESLTWAGKKSWRQVFLLYEL